MSELNLNTLLIGAVGGIAGSLALNVFRVMYRFSNAIIQNWRFGKNLSGIKVNKKYD